MPRQLWVSSSILHLERWWRKNPWGPWSSMDLQVCILLLLLCWMLAKAIKINVMMEGQEGCGRSISWIPLVHFVPDTVSGIGNKELISTLEGLMRTQIFITKARGYWWCKSLSPMQICAENGPPRLPEEDPFELEFKSKRILLKEWSTINRK